MTREEFESLCFEFGITYPLRCYLHPPAGLVEKNPEHWAWARAWRPVPGTVFVHGPEGTGKSSLCRYLLARAIVNSLSAQEALAPDIELSWWQYTREAEREAARYRRVLLIDDISSARWTARGLDVLRLILDSRHERRRVTLVSSQLPIDGLFQVWATVAGSEYATSLVRRFRPVKTLEMTGESFRLTMQYQHRR